MLDNLNDYQTGLLNNLVYNDLDDDFIPGSSIVSCLEKKAESLKNDPKKAQDYYDCINALKESKLDNLAIRDYVNNNGDSGFVGMALFDPDSGETAVIFRGTENLDSIKQDFFAGKANNQVDMIDNLLTAVEGRSPQMSEAISFYAKNMDPNGDNYLFGHSKGGELASEVYAYCYESVKRLNIINPQPINPYKLSDLQLKAFLDSSKVNAISIEGDFVSYLGARPYSLRIVKNNDSDDSFVGPHHIMSMYVDNNGNAEQVKSVDSKYAKQSLLAAGLYEVISGYQKDNRKTINDSFKEIAAQSDLINAEYSKSLNVDLSKELPVLLKKIEQALACITKYTKEIPILFYQDLAKKGNELKDKNEKTGFAVKTGSIGLPGSIKVDTCFLKKMSGQLKEIDKTISAQQSRLNKLENKKTFDGLSSISKKNKTVAEKKIISNCCSWLDNTASNFESMENKLVSQQSSIVVKS